MATDNYPDWLEERFGDDTPDWAEERWGDNDDANVNQSISRNIISRRLRISLRIMVKNNQRATRKESCHESREAKRSHKS